MSKTHTDSQHYKVGIVTEVHGESLYATDTNGEIRQLTVGSTIFSDDKIESRDGSSMIVQASNGQSINIPEDVYDQMLSSAITKELSTAFDAVKDAQTDSSTEPHSNNVEIIEQHTQNDISDFNSDTLKLNDLLSSDENHLTLFSSREMAVLSTHIADYTPPYDNDLCHFLYGG